MEECVQVPNKPLTQRLVTTIQYQKLKFSRTRADEFGEAGEAFLAAGR